MNNNLLKLIQKLENSKDLSNEIKKIDEEQRANTKEKGFVTAAGEGVMLEARDMINFSSFDASKTNNIVDNFSGTSLLNYVTFYDNLAVNTKAPYLESGNVDWALEGASVDLSPTLQSKRLSPYRLTAYVPISKMVINQCGTMGEQFKKILEKAVIDKLVETILSDDSATTTTPAGILNGITPTSLTDVDDVVDMLVSVDKAKTKNTLIISPTAKASLLKATGNYNLFDNATVFGSPFIIEPLLKDDYIIYLDLSKLVVGRFGGVNLIVDPYKGAVSGNTLITINCYFDFDFVGADKFMKVGKI